MTELTGRACLVTGGSRGIGRAIALELGQHGASVAVGYASNKDAADQVVAEIEEAAAGVRVRIDVRRDAVDPLSHGRRGYGKIEYRQQRWDHPRRSLARVGGGAPYPTNLSRSSPDLARLPYMVQGLRRISTQLGIGSTSTSAGQHAAAKAGSSAHEVPASSWPEGLTVNALAQASIETELSRRCLRSSRRDLAKIPLGRFGRPEEIAQAVAFLVLHGDYITGQVIAIDGGLYT